MTPINERIRYPQVRVIDDQNQQLGVLTTREAIDTARDRGLDLILVAPQAQPPVCRIMDYGKFKYEKSKREKKSSHKNAANEMKMVRLHPATSEHDRNVIIRHSEKFLREGHKVRVVCQFKGRENAYPDIGRKQLEKVADALSEFSTVETSPVKQGRDMTMNLAPKAGLKPIPKPIRTGKQKSGEAAADEVIVERTEQEEREEAEFAALQARIAAELGDVEIGEDDASEDADLADADLEDADLGDLGIDVSDEGDASDVDDAADDDEDADGDVSDEGDVTDEGDVADEIENDKEDDGVGDKTVGATSSH